MGDTMENDNPAPRRKKLPERQYVPRDENRPDRDQFYEEWGDWLYNDDNQIEVPGSALTLPARSNDVGGRTT